MSYTTRQISCAMGVLMMMTLASIGGSAEPTPGRTSLHHTPRMDAPGGENVQIFASIFEDWKADSAFLAYRPVATDTAFVEVAFERASESDFVAVIPGRDVQPPGLEYYVGSRKDGAQQLHYASPDAPHRVVVLGETDQTREAARLARHDGHRSTFELYGEFASYGRRAVRNGDGSFETDPNTDWAWTSTLQYRYRILQTLYEISFGLGLIRGHQDTYVGADGESVVADPLSGLDAGREPGMNYGWGQLTLEWHRNFSTDVRLLFGASATGFATGVGGALRVGRIAGPNLELGGEAFQDIGSLAFMRFNWDTLPRLPMALGYELTTRPNPSAPPGNRLVFDLGFDVNDQFTVTARGGYTLRNAAVQSGLMGGLDVAYSF